MSSESGPQALEAARNSEALYACAGVFPSDVGSDVGFASRWYCSHRTGGPLPETLGFRSRGARSWLTLAGYWVSTEAQLSLSGANRPAYWAVFADEVALVGETKRKRKLVVGIKEQASSSQQGRMAPPGLNHSRQSNSPNGRNRRLKRHLATAVREGALGEIPHLWLPLCYVQGAHYPWGERINSA